MYGLIARIIAAEGRRAELIAILSAGTQGMPGCHSYVIAEDAEQADTLWITEVWESSDAHQASLSLPAVQAAIGEGRPLIAGMERIATTRPQPR